APTSCDISLRRSTAISCDVRWREALLPLSTYTRPPPKLTRLFVATVSGTVRESSAAFSTFSLVYSRLADDGVFTSIEIRNESDTGRKLEPPSHACSPMAATRLPTAAAAIHLRWCKAHA